MREIKREKDRRKRITQMMIVLKIVDADEETVSGNRISGHEVTC